MKRYITVGLLTAVVAAYAMAADPPKNVQTKLGLYVTAKEAYDIWREDPEGVKILDIRTFAEFIFVGHPPMAFSIPAFFQTHRWDAEREMFAMQPNPDFVTQVKEWTEEGDTILVTCRSGERAAMAIDLLADAGFSNIYNIVDGMEGAVVKDPESVFYGRRMKNGWQNSGLPWTYEIDLDQVWIPEEFKAAVEQVQ